MAQFDTSCPYCGLGMERRGNESGGYYWQCKNFPPCRGALPETILVKLAATHERIKAMKPSPFKTEMTEHVRLLERGVGAKPKAIKNA